MPSSLTGLFRTLTWSDFPRRNASAPAPGRSATAALTHASYTRERAQFQPIPGTRPPRFQMVDQINVRITLAPDSYVNNWVFTMPQQFQTNMLNHEQGHYNVTALLCRDFFIDVMLLKAQTFATQQAGITAAQQIVDQTLSKMQRVNDLYDAEVHPEQNSGQTRGPIQQKWDGFFQSAFTQPRSTGTTAPDGTPHKVRLVDVLAQNGKRL